MNFARPFLKTKNTMYNIFAHIGQKFLEMLQTPIGWFLGFFLFIADAISGGTLIIYIVVIATVIDLICGIAVAIRRKNFAHSELMRLTVEKLVVYGAAMVVFLCIDKAIESETTLEVNLTSGLVGVVISMTEAWSFLASLLILFPKNPFLRMLQKALIGEIARKLQCEESEVASILNESRKKKSKPKRNSKGQFVSAKKK